MYARKRIHPIVLAIGIIAILILLVLIVRQLDFPGWILRGASNLVPEKNQPAYTPEEVSELRELAGRLEGENVLLKEMIRSERETDEIIVQEEIIGFPVLPAKIIYRDHARIFAAALIDRGTADGVTVGMPVVDADGLVGRVVSTRAAVSRIQLITSPDCAFGVLDQRSREIGVVRGSESIRWEFTDGIPRPDYLELSYLSPSADISVQDILITSGLSGITPPGLRVGEVVEIVSKAEQGSYNIRIRPFADVDHVYSVGVVLFTEESADEMVDILKEEGEESGQAL